jgi:hypothetical protein
LAGFDLGSLKSPLRGGLNALKAAGVKVTSLHPMFGPGTELLSGRHVIFIDMGNAEALTAARALFQPTMAEQVVMSLDEHDRLIAYVLGLAHALNIAFFTALAESGEAAPRLARLSSTTFDAQLDVASDVADESPGSITRSRPERLRRGVAAGVVPGRGAAARRGPEAGFCDLPQPHAAGTGVPSGSSSGGRPAGLTPRTRT